MDASTWSFQPVEESPGVHQEDKLWRLHYHKLIRPCFQNAFTYLLANTGEGIQRKPF